MGRIRSSLWKSYYRLEGFILPGRADPQQLYRDILIKYYDPRSSWLDLGCGHSLFTPSVTVSDRGRELLESAIGRLYGIDLDMNNLRRNPHIVDKVLGDIQRLPLGDGTFSLVSANMVMEHVTDPGAVLAEVGRILVRGGILVIHTPNYLSYKVMFNLLLPGRGKERLISFLQNRREEDVFPTRYRMNRIAVLEELARSHGFKVLECRVEQGAAETVMLGPLVIFELLLMKLLSWKILRKFRSNILVVLQKV
ncbi:MAG: class I SAM-dependent methyltransferase [Candidatus Krumholzibacteriota bacterium]|nr:class I SAM-dependent methyltransferase [Candidatus Krumholzibacteriota bacterium]